MRASSPGLYARASAVASIFSSSASFKIQRSRNPISFLIGALDPQYFSSRSGPHADDGNSARVGGGSLIGIAREVDFYVRHGRLAVGVRGQNEDLIFKIGNEF